MNALWFALALALTSLPLLVPERGSAAVAAATAACRPSQLTMSIAGADGVSDGRSQTGVAITLRNVSSDACLLEGRPRFAFVDPRGHVLSVVKAANPFHGGGHGPVVLPLTLEPQATAASLVRWPAGDVFGAHRSIRAGSLEVDLRGGAEPADPQPLSAAFSPLAVRIYGPAAPAPFVYEQTPWQLPVKRGASAMP